MLRLCMAIFTSVSILLAPAIARAGLMPIYSVNALGTAFPIGINDAGQIAGNMLMSDGQYRAVIYSSGTVQFLGSLDGSYSHAVDINNAGDVVGYAEVAGGGQAAFIYTNGIMARIEGLGNSGSWAYAIGNHGEVVGTANGGLHGGYAFLSSSNAIKPLAELSTALGINESGVIVGSLSNSHITQHAATYTSGVVQDLGTLGGNYSVARKINENQQIIGVSYLAGDVATHAFLYSSGVIVDLGALGGVNSDAFDINDAGQVVGDVAGKIYPGGGTAFIYSNGSMSDLNTLIDPVLGWTIYQARGINDSGQIAAWGCSYKLGCQTLRLDPKTAEVPEPGMFELFSIALSMLAIAHHGRRSKGYC